jgi:hypothetical protein
MQLTRKMTVAGIVLLAILLGTGLLGGVSLMAASVGSNSGSPAAGEEQITDEYIWPPEQQRQREEAIRKRDASLLPECTEEYFAWRAAAKARGKTSAQPPSMSFWGKPGCQGKPDRVGRGDKGGPGPVPATWYEGNNKWYIGNYTVSETTYDRGVYAQMEIIDPGVDDSNDFFAARVLAQAFSNSLEAGWAEYAAPFGDSGQHIYSQDSHTCTGNPPQCDWAEFDSTCDNTRANAQTTVAPVSSNSTYWRSVCWDGDSWNTMINNVNMQSADAGTLEVAGEIKRTVSGETDMTQSGVNFGGITVADASDNWWSWGSTISSAFWGTDSSYTREDVYYYDMFNMKN